MMLTTPEPHMTYVTSCDIPLLTNRLCLSTLVPHEGLGTRLMLFWVTGATATVNSTQSCAHLTTIGNAIGGHNLSFEEFNRSDQDDLRKWAHAHSALTTNIHKENNRIKSHIPLLSSSLIVTLVCAWGNNVTPTQLMRWTTNVSLFSTNSSSMMTMFTSIRLSSERNSNVCTRVWKSSSAVLKGEWKRWWWFESECKWLKSLKYIYVYRSFKLDTWLQQSCHYKLFPQCYTNYIKPYRL